MLFLASRGEPALKEATQRVQPIGGCTTDFLGDLTCHFQFQTSNMDIEG